MAEALRRTDEVALNDLTVLAIPEFKVPFAKRRLSFVERLVRLAAGERRARSIMVEGKVSESFGARKTRIGTGHTGPMRVQGFAKADRAPVGT